MRSSWSGALEVSPFLTLPIRLGNAVHDNRVKLRRVRKDDGAEFKSVRTAEDGKEVLWADTRQAYDAPDGSLVILEDDEVKDTRGDLDKIARVIEFTDPSNLPGMQAARTAYWVQPEPGGEAGYAMLASTMHETGKVAIVRYAMRDREALAVLHAEEGYLLLQGLEWDSDLVRPDFPAPMDRSTDAERRLANTLVMEMSAKYDHAAQVDQSREKLMELINSKVKGGKGISAPPKAGIKTTQPTNLADALRASVEAHKGTDNPPVKTRGNTRRKAA